MNPIDTQIRYALMADAVPVVVVDEVDGGHLTYVGYCLESCAGFADAKWLIKRIEKSKGAIEKSPSRRAASRGAASRSTRAAAPP